MKFPWPGRFGPVRFSIAVRAFGTTDELRFAVAVDIGESGRFIVRLIKHDMLRPMALGAFGIFVPGSLLSGKSDDQDVVPPILVEVINESKKVVRVIIINAQRPFETGDVFRAGIGFLAFKSMGSRIVLMALFEVRSLVPNRPRD